MNYRMFDFWEFKLNRIDQANILHSDLLGVTYNTNKKDGKAASSYARARYSEFPRTDLIKCCWCDKKTTPQRSQHCWEDGLEHVVVCFSCSNKRRAVMRKSAKFIFSHNKKQRETGLCSALRKMIKTLNTLDGWVSHQRETIRDRLNKERIDLISSDFETLGLSKKQISKFFENDCAYHPRADQRIKYYMYRVGENKKGPMKTNLWCIERYLWAKDREKLCLT